MQIGVPAEPAGETRVALVPASLKKLARAGIEVFVEAGAGVGSHYADAEYEAAGATIAERAEVLSKGAVVSIRPVPELGSLAEGTLVVCIADPFRQAETVRAAIEQRLTLVSLDLINRRITRAQAMDVNSSQDNLAGYRAALVGAGHSARVLPMMTTPAGTVRPAKVVVMGSGVAGLQVIATARRLGAVVYGSDVRAAAAEQIESVGGRFVHVEGMEDFEDASGYAKPLTPEFIDQINRTVCGVAADADIIVTTARIFGRQAPITIPASEVARFKAGAVIVDLNASSGGNCELTRPGEVFTTGNGVTIVGIENLQGTVPHTASMLLSNNLTAFLTSIAGESGWALSEEDDVLFGPAAGEPFHVPGMGGVLVCRDGALDPRHTRLAEVIG